MNRKVIQIVSATYEDEQYGRIVGLIALCDDGTIWNRPSRGSQWEQLNVPAGCNNKYQSALELYNEWSEGQRKNGRAFIGFERWLTQKTYIERV